MNNAQKITMIAALIVLFGCRSANEKTADCISVDVNTTYSKKDLVLQDFMDVEYIPLETTDEFITKGFVRAIGQDFLLVTDQGQDGTIFVFDRKTGKGLRKINRLGQGPEEYTPFTELVLDEDTNEMFVVAYSARKIVVYDLCGNFKRSFGFADDTSYYRSVFNYDEAQLICHKSYLPEIETKASSHVLVSKRDGSITREIQLPFEQTKTPVIIEGEATISPGFSLIVPTQNDWVLMRTSSDTIYDYSLDGSLNPIIVRTPSILSMNPEVFLFPTVITDRYYFMQTMKKEMNLTTFKGFPGVDLVYDKQENSVFECTVYNDDFLNKQPVALGQKSGDVVNQEIATCVHLNAFDLVEALEKEELKGELKEIAMNLDEESNPVIMLIKHKKQ